MKMKYVFEKTEIFLLAKILNRVITGYRHATLLSNNLWQPFLPTLFNTYLSYIYIIHKWLSHDIHISYIIIIYDLCNVNNLIKRMCSPCFLCNIQNIWQLWCIFEQVNRDSRQNSSLFCFYTTYWSHKYFPINVFYSNLIQKKLMM